MQRIPHVPTRGGGRGSASSRSPGSSPGCARRATPRCSPTAIRDAGASTRGHAQARRLVERVATGKEPGLADAHAARREGITVKELREALDDRRARGDSTPTT